MKKKKEKIDKITKSLISGRFFRSELFIKNTGLLLLIALYAFIYVSNRYATRQEIAHIKELRTQVTDMRYKLLTLQSELSEKSRQSNIERHIKENNSKLKVATNPPYTVK